MPDYNLNFIHRVFMQHIWTHLKSGSDYSECCHAHLNIAMLFTNRVTLLD
jgi:hypothetical protein